MVPRYPGPGLSFDDLLQEAEPVPAGSEGLQFLPYLSGERTPHPDPLARGAWVGLTLRHGRGHLTRAVLEGVSFGLKDSFSLIQQAGLGEIRQVRASGGGTKGALWRQILASVLEAELVTVNTTEGAAFGAALLAGVGAAPGPMSRRPAPRQSRSPAAPSPIRPRWKLTGKPIRSIGNSTRRSSQDLIKSGLKEISMPDFHGLPTAALDNEHIRLEYLTTAGPRIVGLSYHGSPNLLADVHDMTSDTPHGKFHFLGGHRLWISPEVARENLHPGWVRPAGGKVPNGVNLTGRVNRIRACARG